jgi:hypothetical protein
MIRSGNVLDFVVMIGLMIAIYLMMSRAEKKMPKLRRIPALDALEEAVGRAAETGRPILFTQGSGGTGTLSHPEEGPQIMSGLNVLSHLAALAANLGPRIICCVGQSDSLIPTTEIVREAYIAQGMPEAFREDDIRFLGSGNAYAFAAVDIIRTEEVAAAFFIGPFYNESLTFVFHSDDVGAMKIGGTAFTHQMPFFAAVCDYFMIGEEIYAAGAYLSGEAEELGSVVGEDFAKGFSIILIILAVAAASFGLSGFLNFMRI